MNLVIILVIVFLFLTGADAFYFYLGKKGALDGVKGTSFGKKAYHTVHSRIKHRVKHHSFFAVLGIKLLYGIAIFGLIYLGERMPFRKFIFYDILVNASLCTIIYSFVSFLDARLDNVLAGINYVQTQVLLIVCAIAILYAIQRFFAKRGIKLV
jgi:membrane protein DedA with SNARE-associated domain